MGRGGRCSLTHVVCPPDVRVSLSSSHYADPSQISREGRSDADHPMVAGRPMDGGDGGTVTVPPCPPTGPALDITVIQGSEGAPVSGVDVMCQHIRATGLKEDIAVFITSSVRGSSLKSYKSMWQSWCGWCQTNRVDPSAPSEIQLTYYLWSLFQDKGLAAANLKYIDRAAISSLVQPLSSVFSSSQLLKHFMRAAFFTRPPARAWVWTTWNVLEVITFLRARAPIDGLSLCELTHRTSLVLLVFFSQD